MTAERQVPWTLPAHAWPPFCPVLNPWLHTQILILRLETLSRYLGLSFLWDSSAPGSLLFRRQDATGRSSCLCSVLASEPGPAARAPQGQGRLSFPPVLGCIGVVWRQRMKGTPELRVSEAGPSLGTGAIASSPCTHPFKSIVSSESWGPMSTSPPSLRIPVRPHLPPHKPLEVLDAGPQAAPAYPSPAGTNPPHLQEPLRSVFLNCR